MASIIKADTLQSTTANVFVLNSSGTEYARFNSSGNLGIGTASPGGKVEITAGTGTGLYINQSGSTGNGTALYIRQPVTSGYAPLEIDTSAGTSVFQIESDGRITLNGGGIVFPATQIASANANTLDDYEEGTWTPQHSDATNVTQSGICGYVKIGSFVYVNFDITVTKTTASLANFPFAGANLGGATNYPWYSGYNTAARTGSNAAGHMNNGSTSVNFYDGGNAYSLTVGMRVIGAMSYRT